MSGIQWWLCGGCGLYHGWVCPYFGSPAAHLTAEECVEAKRQLEEDLKNGTPKGFTTKEFEAKFLSAATKK